MRIHSLLFLFSVLLFAACSSRPADDKADSITALFGDTLYQTLQNDSLDNEPTGDSLENDRGDLVLMATDSLIALMEEMPDIDGAPLLNHNLFFKNSQDLVSLRNAGEIGESLEKTAFKPGSVKTVKEEYGESNVTAVKREYTNQGTTVSVVVYGNNPIYVEIRFANDTQAKEFITRMQTAGWVVSYGGNDHGVYHNNGSGMTVDGKTVVLTAGG